MENEKSSMLEITGLWANKSKNGDTYYSGYMGKSAILIFKNNYKTEDKHPDLRMFVAEGRQSSEGGKKKDNGTEIRRESGEAAVRSFTPGVNPSQSTNVPF